MSSLENRLHRIERKVEDLPPGEPPAPINKEHAHVRQQIRQVEREYLSLPPEGGRTKAQQAKADALSDRYLDLVSADHWLGAADGELLASVRERLAALA